MKKLLFLSLFLISFAGFGQRVLTAEEKESLKTDPVFIYLCEWSTNEFASYWAIHDGDFPTEVERVRWAKYRQNSVKIYTGSINDPDIALRYLKVGKSIQYNIGAAPQPNSVIIAAMLSGNKFEEMASLYFDLLGEGVNFSIGGN